MNTTHSENALIVIDDELHSLGIIEYRFCIENDCYVCDKLGNVYSVCHRQHSKSGRLIEHYRVCKSIVSRIDRIMTEVAHG